MKDIVASGNRLYRQSDMHPLANFSSPRAAIRALMRLGGGDPGPGADSRKDLQTERILRELLARRENVSLNENSC